MLESNNAASSWKDYKFPATAARYLLRLIVTVAGHGGLWFRVGSLRLSLDGSHHPHTPLCLRHEGTTVREARGEMTFNDLCKLKITSWPL